MVLFVQVVEIGVARGVSDGSDCCGFRGEVTTAEAGIRLTTQGKGAWIPTSVGVIMEHL